MDSPDKKSEIRAAIAHKIKLINASSQQILEMQKVHDALLVELKELKVLLSALENQTDN